MIFARLKQETHTYHTQLENTVDILNRMQTIPQYQTVLEIFYGFYQPLEVRLGAVQGIEAVGFQIRRKVDLLRSDLLSLGLTETEIDHLSLCQDLPGVSTLAQALGCLYVLEGATLGGQIITRQIQKHPSLSLPHTFFTGYGVETGRQWKALQELTEQSFPEQRVYPIIATSAQETFDKLNQWFQARTS